MPLSPAAQRVWAKSGYDPERRRWLPLWLHLLDSAAVAEHLAREWVGPTISDLLEREFSGSTSSSRGWQAFTTSASARQRSPFRSRASTTR